MTATLIYTLLLAMVFVGKKLIYSTTDMLRLQRMTALDDDT